MADVFLSPESVARFSDEARQALYDAIALRRDVRHFRSDVAIDEATLARILGAAHLAPSVGFSQPWGFIVVRSRETRARVRDSFLRCRQAEATRFPQARREAYLAHKLEGILEAPLNVCVVVDLRSRGEAILGTTVQPEAVRASACCAVQNLWLAARVEGIGVGWVSIVEPSVLRDALALPAGVSPIAYLCVGAPRAFRDKPMLEETGWLPRRALADAVHEEVWPREPASGVRAESAKERERAQAPEIDERVRQAARDHQRDLAKPAGSLGKLEDVAAWYAAARGAFPAEPPERAVLAVFAADHGVTAEAVSAYGSQATAAVVCNVMAGGAAVNVLARRYGVDLVLVDVGIAGDMSAAPTAPVVPLVSAKVQSGTQNLREGDAMTRAEALRAMDEGERTLARAVATGAEIVGVGEVGIGNTTAAAALICAFTGAPPEVVVGNGTGIDEATRARKIRVVEAALARIAGRSGDSIDVLAAVGGLELAAMAGFIQAAARARVPVVLDGFLAGASALAACAIDPHVRGYLLASHASAERGARLALDALGLTPCLDLGLRLGEGTGAVLGIDLVRTSVALASEMATFATLGIPSIPRGA